MEEDPGWSEVEAVYVYLKMNFISLQQSCSLDIEWAVPCARFPLL